MERNNLVTQWQREKEGLVKSFCIIITRYISTKPKEKESLTKKKLKVKENNRSSITEIPPCQYKEQEIDWKK